VLHRSPSLSDDRSLVDGSLLHDVLAAVEQGLHDSDADHGPLAMALEAVDGHGVEVATRTYETDDVVAALADLDASASWLAFGVVCEGRAHPTDARCRPLHPPPPGSPERVRFGVLVDRNGTAVTGLRRATGHFDPLPDGPALGRVPDACRRVLGLPTAAPVTPIDQLFTMWWLDRLLEASLRSPGSLSWSEAAALHPGNAPASHLGRRGTTVDEALDASRAAAADVTWDRLRQLVAGEPASGRLVSPDLAAWMDTGMFSRELLSNLPDRATLLVDLEPTVAPAVAEGLRRTLDRWSRP